MNDQIGVRHSTDLQLNRIIKFPGQSSGVLVDKKLFTSSTSSKEKKYITYCGSLDEPTQTVLHSEEAEYVAILDYVNKTLKVFSSIDNEHLFDIPLTGIEQPLGVHLTSDGVLVSDFRDGKLSKYSLTPSEEPLWTCNGLREPSGITTDELGCIYVTSKNVPIIHLISPKS